MYACVSVLLRVVEVPARVQDKVGLDACVVSHVEGYEIAAAASGLAMTRAGFPLASRLGGRDKLWMTVGRKSRFASVLESVFSLLRLV